MTRLLLVDDNRAFAAAFEAAFSDLGYEVLTLDHGDCLPELLHQQNFDVVILDNYLGGKTGVEILQQLNRVEEDTGWRKPPVVLVSGGDSTDVELRARLAKADFFLLKPFRYRDLEKRIQEALKKKQVENGNQGEWLLGGLRNGSSPDEQSPDGNKKRM